jgi:hypothetical protein
VTARFRALARAITRLSRAFVVAVTHALRALAPRDHSGPAVARLFHRLLALVFLDAWLSLAVQVHLLIGSRGLMPAARFLDYARSQVSFTEFPTLFWIHASDAILSAGVVAGALCALAALAGLAPRVLTAVQVALYLSYATIARTFLSFQWDNLLLECGFFAIFLPRHRRDILVHTIFRLILFKLYWESGLAKWQSVLHDWKDGSAMAYYYETAPLPTALAWYAHHLPAWWHALESRATLAFELVVPVLAFAGPRRIRLACAFILTGFQIVNAATANYGFFCYLAVALHVFLFDDADVERAGAWLRARLRRFTRPSSAPPASAASPALAASPAPASPVRRRARLVVGIALLTVFVLVSVNDGLINFVQNEDLFSALLPYRRIYGPWRVINSYHLFAQITRERIEPELQTTDDALAPDDPHGDRVHWTAHDLHHKPGDPHRRPDWVAPHQPRVDFQLWFYGLSRGTVPEYVVTLIERVCRDPSAVQPLFRARLSLHPRAARLVFWRYHFSTAAERRATGAWWTRTPVGASEPIPCDIQFPDVTGADDS